MRFIYLIVSNELWHVNLQLGVKLNTYASEIYVISVHITEKLKFSCIKVVFSNLN